MTNQIAINQLNDIRKQVEKLHDGLLSDIWYEDSLGMEAISSIFTAVDEATELFEEDDDEE